MPPWLIKAGIQRGISLLPHSHRWNELFQRHVTRSLTLERAGFESRLTHCRRHLQHYAELRPGRPLPATALEVGTGWYPVVAVGLFLCGVEIVWTYDIAPLLARDRMHRMLEFFDDYESSGELNQHLPAVLPGRVERLHRLRGADVQPRTVLADVGIHAVVGDASRTGLPPKVIDLIFSTAVLEYIPFPALVQLFRELHRVASPAAAMSHFVDLTDQYSHFDPGISPLNFLRYPTRHWNNLDNPLIPLNRLRISDYRSAFAQSGWEIRREITDRYDESRPVRIAPEFRRYSMPDLLVLRAWLTALPQAGP